MKGNEILIEAYLVVGICRADDGQQPVSILFVLPCIACVKKLAPSAEINWPCTAATAVVIGLYQGLV